MAHSGCACHSSLPRHRFHSLKPQEIYQRAKRTEDAITTDSALAGVIDSQVDTQDQEVHHRPKHAKTGDPELDRVGDVRTVLTNKRPANFNNLPEATLVRANPVQANPDCRLQTSNAAEDLLTIIPASLDEACFQVPLPEGSESLGEKMRAILCTSSSAALYCTPARRGGTVYWIAQTSLPVNERAVRATGVAGISGDAVLIENKEYGPLQLAIPSQEPIHRPSVSLERKSFEFQSQELQVEEGNKKRREDIAVNEQLPSQTEVSHKRGLGEGLELSTLKGGVRTASCSPPEEGDPLVKKPRQAEVEGHLFNIEQAVEVDSNFALKAEASKVCTNHSFPLKGLEKILKATEASEQEVLSVEGLNAGVSKVSHQRLVLLESSQALPIGKDVKGASHQQGDSVALAVHSCKLHIDSDTLEPSSLGNTHLTNEVERSSVDSLSVGELQTVFSYLAFSDLSTASAVCKLWRASISEDEPLLKNLRIRRRMFQPTNAPATLNRSKFHCEAHPLPFVLLRAAELSNVPAMVLVAEEMERQGNRTKALEWFKKAARKGDQASQYRIGEAFYRGDSDWPQDGEEAIIWLSRAAKFLDGDKRLCGAAGLLLGYMHLDGEGIAAADNTEAVRWFRFAADMGNREAEKTVGWLWNTGQF